MKLAAISTSYLMQAPRLALQTLEAQLADANKELASGKHADIGVALGYQVGQDVSLRTLSNQLTTLTDTNGLVASRMEATQGALTGLVSEAQDFINTMLSASSGDAVSASSLISKAKSALAAYSDTMNTSYAGDYLFAGINSDAKPVAAYEQTPASAAANAVAGSFMASFGFAQGDAAASGISGSDMQTYLDGAFANEFAPASWSANWSSASDGVIASRISTSEIVDTSVSANEQAFRLLASAYTMVADLGIDKLGSAARQTAIQQSAKLAGQAIQLITGLQGGLGVVQSRVTAATTRLSVQSDLLTSRVDTLESVDPYEAATRVSALQTQVQTAMALTAQMQNLSLVNYL